MNQKSSVLAEPLVPWKTPEEMDAGTGLLWKQRCRDVKMAIALGSPSSNATSAKFVYA